MPGSLRVASIALASCLVAAAFNVAGAAYAQVAINPVQGYHVQTPQPAPPPTVVHNNVAGTVAVLNEPRFIVEAVEFIAVDETGPNNPGSDEIFAIFDNPQNTTISSVFGNVDTEDVIQFPANERCIWPAVDPDGNRNHRWACNPAGGRGPVSFAISLYEVDPDYGDIYPAGFCIELAATDVLSPRGRNCDADNSDTAFHGEFTFETSDILAHLDPSCRCWLQTARWRETDWRGDTEYQVRFLITRVDTGNEPPAVDLHADDGPTVLASGTLTATQGRGFELDAGQVVQTGGDFGFTRSGGNHFLTPAGGAKIWVGNATARGYAQCYAQRMSASYVTTQINVPAAGSYACFVTNDGHVGELRIDSLTTSPLGASSLALTYTTWQ